MPELFHERRDAKDLILTLAAAKRLAEQIVEKDYWVMHCVWGLQQSGLRFEIKGGTSLSKGWGIIDRFSEDIDIRFDPPPGLRTEGNDPGRVAARRAFFDDLAGRIRIPGITTERNPAFDDEHARNGGISLRYDSHFAALPGLRPSVLLEVGFERTAPNEPRTFSSWVYDSARAAGLDIADNRGMSVKCFAPEYTFVDKLQTICRRFRQFRDRRDPVQDVPRQFLRHYYDLFKLLGEDRVVRFMKTEAYEEYREQKLGAADAMAFAARSAFTLPDPETYALFKDEYAALRTLVFGEPPSFDEVMARIRHYESSF